MQPLISAIIPVYNHAHTLKKCVDSILNQDYRSIEIIIVNDGSTDDFNGAILQIKQCHPEFVSGSSISKHQAGGV